MPYVDRDLEPADTLAGRLQRGQGAGFLDALEASRDESARILMDMCTGRLRRAVDRQVDQRSRYLAEIMHLLELPVEPLLEHAKSAVDPETGEAPYAGAVLEQLARRGSTEALCNCVEQLSQEPNWEFDLDTLLEWGLDVSGARSVLLERFPTEERRREVFSDRQFRHRGRMRTWVESIPEFARYLDPEFPPKGPGKRDSSRKRKRSDQWLIDMSTRELLDAVAKQPGVRYVAANAISHPEHDLDIDVALEAARHAEPKVRGVAFMGLGHRQVDNLLDIAVPLAGPGRSGAPGDDDLLAFRAYLSLQSLRTDRAVEAAREWISRDDALAQAALAVLAARAPVPELAAAFDDVQVDDLYVACNVMDELLERDEPGAEGMAREILQAAGYDMLRERCVKYLTAHDTRFRTVDGLDMLWDASDQNVRPSAIVGLDLSLTRERLHELAGDPASDVSESAGKRLGRVDMEAAP